MELAELLEDVVDAASFLKFAEQLRGERGSASRVEMEAEWESMTAPQFLEGSISWARTTQFGASQGLDAENPWRLFAVFLYCGRIY